MFCLFCVKGNKLLSTDLGVKQGGYCINVVFFTKTFQCKVKKVKFCLFVTSHFVTTSYLVSLIVILFFS